MQIPFAQPWITEDEVQAACEVVRSGWLSQGEKVEEFERCFAQYIGTSHAVAMFNGTVALHSILLALGIGSGDEVIVPSVTFISTATSVIHAQATPIFADVDDQTLCLDPEDVARKITRRTAAIMTVHYAGQPYALDTLADLCRQNGLAFIEDAAEAHGAHWERKMVGRFGDAAMFSFTPTKNITCGEGGIITTSDDVLAEKLRLLRNHGVDRPYHHVLVGYNYRMTDIQAAIALQQMRKLEEAIRRKQRNADILSEYLSECNGILPPYVHPAARHVYMIYTIRVSKEAGISRDEVALRLRERGIPTKVYFPPAHSQPALEPWSAGVVLPRTEHAANEILSLPFFASMTQEQVHYVGSSIQHLLEG